MRQVSNFAATAFWLAGIAFLASASAWAADIHVTSATYGGNCRQPAGNVTEKLAAACDGHAVCHYSVDFHVLGDPAVGCQKDFSVTWRCGQSRHHHTATAAAEAGYGSKVRLHC